MLRHGIFGLALLVAAVGVDLANAQTEPSEESRTDVLEAAIDEIVASRDATQQQIQTILEGLEATTLEIEEADALFDSMIETLRAQAALGDPDGAMVERINRLEDMAIADAEEARLAGFTDFETAFLEDAEIFADQRDQAVGMWEALDRRIRGIEAERERVVFLIKLSRYDEAQGLIEEGLGELRKVDERIQTIEAGLRQSDDAAED
jgi:hypothetical protein